MPRFNASVEPEPPKASGRNVWPHDVHAVEKLCQPGAASIGVVTGTLVALTLLSVLAVAGCSERPAVAEQSNEPEVIPVLAAKTISLEPMTWPTIERCQGTLSADEVAEVGTRVAGRVADVHVNLGDSVEAGQPLVTLQADEFELLVAQAEAELDQARSAVGLRADELSDRLDPENSPPVREQRAVWDEAKASLQRAKSLRQQDAISQGEFDLAASAERVAEASYAAAVNSVREKLSIIGVRRVELALAKQRLEDAVIRAPFDGFVQKRRVAPGSYISAGNGVVSVVRTDPIWFHGTLSERYASQVVIGLEMTVQIQALRESVTATVTRISPALDEGSLSLRFEARIANPQQSLRAGLFAQADVVLDAESKSLVVPESAVSDFAGSEKVWKLVDGVAQQLEITTGVRRGGYIEIIEGLSGGDTILHNAAEGRVARVIAEESPTVAGPAADDKGDREQSRSSTDEKAVSENHQRTEGPRSEPKVLTATAKLAEGRDGAGKKRGETMAGAPATAP